MIQGLIGKKIGMTQMFASDGAVIPVTILRVGPCVIVQKKIRENNNRLKVQVGLVEERKVKGVSKPMQGCFKKANVPPTRILREFSVDSDSLNVGDTIKVDIFAEKEKVNVMGITKGKGFQGVVKRHGYSGGRGSHGSMFHRRVGSIGSNTDPGRVIKGKGMPGRMGGGRRTARHLEVVKVDSAQNILLVRGAVPGFNGNYILITKDSFKRS